MDTTTARFEYCQFGRCRPADRRAGVPLAGLCWYPIVSHPGWMMVDTAPTGSWATLMRRGSALGMSRWPANSDASRRSSVTCLVPWRERGGHRDLRRPTMQMNMLLYTESPDPSGMG